MWFFAPAIFRSCVVSLSRCFENEIVASVLFFFLLLNIALAIYRTCNILLLWSPYKKITCFTKKCLSTSWGSPPHLFYPIFHWFNFWCIHTNAFSYQLSPHKVIELEHKINPLWDLAISNLVLPLMAPFPSLFQKHRSGSLSKILMLLIRSLQKIAIPCHSMMIFKGNKFFTKMKLLNGITSLGLHEFQWHL